MHRNTPPGYRALRVASAGPLATVLQALRLADGLVVALKCWQAGTGDASTEAPQRLHREAMLLAQLQHPAIVPLLDHGVLQGRPWLAMPWMSGGSLADRLALGPLADARQAAHLGAVLAQALHHAHGRGVLHRDLKPSNVLLADSGWDARLGDFGLAQWDASQTATRTGVWLASPAYAAPEQLLGAPLSAASDLYALGVLLFEALAGRLPFASRSMGELLRTVAHQPAPALQTLRPQVPAALAHAVALLLAKHPQQRPESAAAVAQLLLAAAKAP